MYDIVIRVRGEHHESLPAERGIVHFTVSDQGPDVEQVRTRVERACEGAIDSIMLMHDEDDGPVRRYTVDQVRTSVQRPWNTDGGQPPVHHASVRLSVEFDDFAAMGRWLRRLACSEHVQVDWIAWDLEEEHRRAAERGVRQEALRQAQQRAKDYADALGLGEVRVRRIADVGLLTEPQPLAVAAARGIAPPAVGEGQGDLLHPDVIEVRAGVDSEFVILPG